MMQQSGPSWKWNMCHAGDPDPEPGRCGEDLDSGGGPGPFRGRNIGRFGLNAIDYNK